MQKPIFIEVHDRYDFSHKIMINVYAIETIESNKLCLFERYYEVAENYEEIKMLIEAAKERREDE